MSPRPKKQPFFDLHMPESICGGDRPSNWAYLGPFFSDVKIPPGTRFRPPFSRFRPLPEGKCHLQERGLRRRTQYAGPYVPMPGSHPPKNRLLSISMCQRPHEVEIGRPNAAKYGLTLSDVKTPPGIRIMAAFLRNLGAGPWARGWPVSTRRAGCWEMGGRGWVRLGFSGVIIISQK